MTERRFDGRVAVITGAGRGLGREYARLLASRGAKIVVNDLGGSMAGEGRDAGPAESVVQEIRAAGGEAVANTDSVATPEGGQAIVQSALDRYGRIDILAGVSDWRDYGWDDAFDEKGQWQRGPLHGYVWFHRNIGTNENPEYAEPVKLNAGGKPIDQYGSPIPNPVDWFGAGRFDLVLSNFIDRVFIARNTGNGLAAPVPLEAGGKPIIMDLCMIQPRVVPVMALATM